MIPIVWIWIMSKIKGNYCNLNFILGNLELTNGRLYSEYQTA